MTDLSPSQSSQQPSIQFSIIIPAYNEAGFIGPCIQSILDNDYPQSDYEIIVVDGNSSDATVDIVQSFKFPTVRVIPNPKQVTPIALNLGIRAARFDHFIILGAHAKVAPDFLARNRDALIQTNAACVGGRIETVSQGALGELIAVALSSRFGVGGVRFRTSNASGYVDTVAFGAYKKAIVETIGYFDEELVRNQDDEFNFRLTQSGEKIYFDPEIKATYYSRPTLPKLLRQYYQYGYWKVRVIQKRGKVPALRHLIPLVFVDANLTALVLTLIPMTSRIGQWMFAAIYIPYSILALAEAMGWCFKRGHVRYLTLPLFFLVVHWAYGIGFAMGLLNVILGRRNLDPTSGTR